MNATNLIKGNRYGFAWDRIRRASRAGCHLEAVTICESIMSDRLTAYLAAQASEPAKSKTDFCDLIKRSKRQAGNVSHRCKSGLSWTDAPAELQTTDLLGEIDTWRQSRNTLVHGIVKPKRSGEFASVAEFAAEAKASARRGEELARLLIRWVDRQKRKSVSRGESPRSVP